MHSPHFSVGSDSRGIMIKMNVKALDMTKADEIKIAMRNAVEGQSADLSVDMATVEFVDSSGLGALVSVRKRLDQGKEMRLHNVSQNLAKLLALTKLDRVFSVH